MVSYRDASVASQLALNAMAANDTMDVDAAESSSGLPSTDYKLHMILSGHTASISSLKFSPNGSMLASAGVSPAFWSYGLRAAHCWGKERS